MVGKRTGCLIRPWNPAEPSEVGFVYKSWLGSYKNYAGETPHNIYRKLYQGYLDRIIKRPGCSVLVACDPNDSEVLWGFIVFEKHHPVVHYIYVKEGHNLRRNGIGSDLLAFCTNEGETEFTFTFNTRMGRNFLRKRSGTYNPKFVRNDLP